jgi:Na+-driven multidrug efflux pump
MLCACAQSAELDASSSIGQRLRALLTIAAPLVFSYFLRLGESFIAIYFASHLSRAENDTAIFAGISLAQMFVTISSVSLFIGMSTALETLGSQFNGAKNYPEVGIALQRSVVVLSMMLGPVLVLWYFAEDIFLAVHVDKHICEILKEYISVMVCLKFDLFIFITCVLQHKINFENWICLFIYLFIYFIYLSIYLSIDRSIYLF